MRGADTDAGGRRDGPVDPDEQGEGIEKEELPAYESGAKSGPPRYVDVMMGGGGIGGVWGRAFGGGRTTTTPAATQPAAGGEMEMGNMNRHPADRPLGDPF